MKLKCTILFISLSLLFTGCSAFYGEGNGIGSSLGRGCEDNFTALFQQTYYGFLKTNCDACHTVGGVGKGGFADGNVTDAFEEFDLRGALVIGDRAKDPNHQPPFTGAHLAAEADSIKAQWDLLSSQLTCETGVTPIPGAQTDEPIPESSTYQTVEKIIPNSDSGSQTMSWDLTNDFMTPGGTSYPGSQFAINIEREVSPTGDQSYLFSAPTLQAGENALKISYIEVYINGSFISSASTYRGIDRNVPANQTRGLSSTTMVAPFSFQDGDTLAIAFGILEPTEFNPQSFQQITSQVFGPNCNNCHSGANASAGLDLTNYEQMRSQFMVIPFSPSGSEIYKRMIDTENPMPRTGVLPESDTNKVKDWILDGAPNN